MAAAAALRQLVTQTIRRRIAAGPPSITGGAIMAKGHHLAGRCVRSYTSEVAARQERTEHLIRESERGRIALRLVTGALYASGFALIYCGTLLPTEAQLGNSEDAIGYSSRRLSK